MAASWRDADGTGVFGLTLAEADSAVGNGEQDFWAMEEVIERKIVNPWKWQDQYGFVQANEVTGGERTLYCAGQTSVDAEGNPVHARDMRAQITQALDNLDAVLGAAGFGMPDVVRLNFFTTDVDQTMEAWSLIKSRLAQAGCRQASTLLGVARLYHPDILIEIEATAVR